MFGGRCCSICHDLHSAAEEKRYAEIFDAATGENGTIDVTLLAVKNASNKVLVATM